MGAISSKLNKSFGAATASTVNQHISEQQTSGLQMYPRDISYSTRYSLVRRGYATHLTREYF